MIADRRSQPDAQLVRAIGPRELTMSIINVTIASSIFLMPATVAERLGPAAPLAYLVCASLMTLIALCFAAAGSRVSLTGGLYAYIDIAFGGFAGFLGGYLYAVTACLSVASVAAAFAGTAGVLWPAFAGGSARALLLGLLFVALAAVNVRGIKPGIRLVEAITVAKLVPLLFLVVAGSWSLNVDFLRMSMPTASQVGQASIVLLFAFVGVEVALTPSGEIRDPARTVPRSILTALALATSLYLAVQTVAQGTLGPELPLYKDAPLVETATRLFGQGARLMFLLGMAVSIFGYIAGDMLGTPRVLFALAREGVGPAPQEREHPR
jgi:amino acid transporter